MNAPYGFPVVTGQEKFLRLSVPADLIQTDEARFQVRHDMAQIPFNTACLTNEPVSGLLRT
jgi:hypothetical protein